MNKFVDAYWTAFYHIYGPINLYDSAWLEFKKFFNLYSFLFYRNSFTFSFVIDTLLLAKKTGELSTVIGIVAGKAKTNT